MRILTLVLLLSASGALVACRSTGAIDHMAQVRASTADPCKVRAAGPTLCGHQEPIYECYEEPIYRTCKEPIYGDEVVPVYRIRKKPVTWPVTDWCTGCTTDKTLWSVNQRVQVGTKRVRTCIGYRNRRELVGHCRKRRIVGWRTVEPAPQPCP